MKSRFELPRLFQFSSVRMSLAVAAAFVAASLLIIALVLHEQRKQALIEAEAKATIILNRNLATHTYFNRQLKPGLFSWTDPFRRSSYFDPVWMSSTFAIREIDNIFQSISREEYYYKECAVNARSPRNEADEYERGFIRELNADSKLEKLSGVRVIDGKPFFFVLRRGEVMEGSCMRCHSEPGRAPGDMLVRYGADRSFHRAVGEVVSAVSVRIPLERAYAEANRFALRLSGLMLGVLFFLFAGQLWLSRHFLSGPLSVMRNKALQISESGGHLGEEIPLPSGRELNELASAFNKMSAGLRNTLDQLEDRVRARTKELETLNLKLAADIAEREKVEQERERLILELRQALVKVKTLSGLIPICASCKKVRDDSGYWNQIEAYISEHSEAEFSHAICPDCFRRLYPGYTEK